MKKIERFVIYSSLAVMALMIAGGRTVGTDHQALGAADAAREPAPAKIATCDVYYVMRQFLDSAKYKPARQAEEEKANAELKELAETIKGMERDLNKTDPKDPSVQIVFHEYQEKKKAFAQRQEKLDDFLGKQFVEAYEVARGAVNAVAARMGYTHVVATRRKDDKPSSDTDKITQAMLSRPMLRSPAEDDVTDAVVAELKIE